MTVTRHAIATVLSIVALVLVLVVVVFAAVISQERDGKDPINTPPVESASSDGGFPTASTTGVPRGVALSDYSGPCAITADGTVISDSKIACDRLVIQAADVTVRRSSLNRIDIDDAEASVTVEDSDVNGGEYAAPAIGYYNVTLRRVHVRGGTTSVLCGSNCIIEDSLLHQQAAPQADQHLGGYLSNGGSKVTIRHNSIQCSPPDNATGGGCTGDAQIFGDFGPLSDYTFERNLFRATPGGYCASFGYNPGARFGESVKNVKVVDNVFERGPNGKCGTFGGATSFLAAGAGNVWKNNTWDDGTAIGPP